MEGSSTRTTGGDIDRADAGGANLAVPSRSAGNPGVASPRLFEVETTHATICWSNCRPG
jgi:hypothetical protein